MTTFLIAACLFVTVLSLLGARARVRALEDQALRDSDLADRLEKVSFEVDRAQLRIDRLESRTGPRQVNA